MWTNQQRLHRWHRARGLCSNSWLCLQLLHSAESKRRHAAFGAAADKPVQYRSAAFHKSTSARLSGTTCVSSSSLSNPLRVLKCVQMYNLPSIIKAIPRHLQKQAFTCRNSTLFSGHRHVPHTRRQVGFNKLQAKQHYDMTEQLGRKRCIITA